MKPMPALSMQRVIASGPRSIRTPSADNTSAAPERDDSARFPCLATGTPQPATTNAAQVETLKLEDGKEVDWRRDVAMRLINLQKRDGSWENDNGRWWEKDANLVTAYAVMALEIIHRTM